MIAAGARPAGDATMTDLLRKDLRLPSVQRMTESVVAPAHDATEPSLAAEGAPDQGTPLASTPPSSSSSDPRAMRVPDFLMDADAAAAANDVTTDASVGQATGARSDDVQATGSRLEDATPRRRRAVVVGVALALAGLLAAWLVTRPDGTLGGDADSRSPDTEQGSRADAAADAKPEPDAEFVPVAVEANPPEPVADSSADGRADEAGADGSPSDPHDITPPRVDPAADRITSDDGDLERTPEPRVRTPSKPSVEPEPIDDPGLAPSPPDKPKPLTCEEHRTQARAAASASKWSTVLVHTRDEECWRGAAGDRTRLRVEALMNLGRNKACASEAAHAKDPDVLRWRETCFRRTLGGE